MNKTEAVANYFIAMGMNEEESFMSNLRLNKLMFYAQAWCLATSGKPLFEADFEAWDFGPVIPAIYQKYKKYKGAAITEVSPDFSLSVFDSEEIGLLSAVMASYEKYSAVGLTNLSHEKGEPWDITIQKEGRNGIISKALIKECFKKKEPIRIVKPADILQTVGYHDKDGTLILPADWKEGDRPTNA